MSIFTLDCSKKRIEQITRLTLNNSTDMSQDEKGLLNKFTDILKKDNKKSFMLEISKLKNKSSEIFIEALLQSESNLEQDLETSLKRAYIFTRLAQNTLSLSIDEKIKIQQDFFTSIYKAVCKKVNSRKPFLHFTKKDFDDKTAEFIRRVLIFAWSNSHELIFEKNIKDYLKDMRLSYEEFQFIGTYSFKYVDKLIMITMEKTGVMFTLLPL